jgi:dehydrogenase/reductase SDR family protein 7B
MNKKSFFKNKVVLITGASSGLGAAFAEELYPFDTQLILCARRLDELNKVKEGLFKLKTINKHEPEVVCLDVTDPFDIVKKKLDLLFLKFSCIDILINNAGVSFRGEVYLS